MLAVVKMLKKHNNQGVRQCTKEAKTLFTHNMIFLAGDCVAQI